MKTKKIIKKKNMKLDKKIERRMHEYVRSLTLDTVCV